METACLIPATGSLTSSRKPRLASRAFRRTGRIRSPEVPAFHVKPPRYQSITMATKKKAAKPAAKKCAPKPPSRRPPLTKEPNTFTPGAPARPTATATMKPLLGGKGANLAEMTRIGLPVPPGFTITTEVCTYYYAHKRTYPQTLQAQMEAGVAQHGEDHGLQVRRRQGHPAARRRALRRARLDARHDGHDPQPRPQRRDRARARRRPPSNERFAWDCYRRFVQMYGDVVLGVQKRAGEDHEPFEVVIENFKHEQYEQGHRRLRPHRRRPARNSSSASRRSSRSAPATASRTIRGSSSTAPPAPCSAPG